MPTEKIDTIANITFINPSTNRRLRTAPNVYIRKYKIKIDELKKQLIPVDEELLRIENYEEFLEARSKLIAKELSNYLKNLYPDYYEEMKTNKL